MKKQATLDIYRSGNGEWRWRVKHGNGQVLAASSEGFSGKAGAKRNFKRARTAVNEVDWV